MDVERHRLTVVSNRGPIQYAVVDGERVALRGGGGLVSALRGLIGAHDVTWIVCAISPEDHVVAAEQDGIALDETDAAGNAFRLHFAEPDPADFAAMYGEIANPLLWFIQHGLYAAGEEPVVSSASREAWAGYRRYNAAVAAEAASERDCDALMVHDYQLYLVPAMLREAGVDAPILHFTHIPWPEPEAWLHLPVDLRTELLHGLLGADIVGFHTAADVRRFLATCVELLPDVAVDHAAATVAVTRDGATRAAHVRAYPISIDPPELRAAAQQQPMLDAHAALVRERPERLILRVDRTDPSKNILRGFHAYERLLERRPDLHGHVRMLALLDPSRLAVPAYAAYLERIHAITATITERFARDGWLPIDLRIGDTFPVVVAAYREYDVLLVNSIADGMNLISKEAPLLNERDGVVVLSERAGSFEELAPWVLAVDPLDVEQTAAQLEAALELPAAERAARAGAIRAFVEEHDVERWISLQLHDLEQLADPRVTEPILIVAALNGTRSPEQCPKVPLAAKDVAAEAARAVEAGAGLLHVHARKPDGAPAFDFVIDEIVAAIRGAVDAPIAISTQRAQQTSLGTVTALFQVLSDLPDAGAVHVRPPEPDLPAHREEARQILEALEAADVRPVPVAGSLDALGDLQALYADSLLGRAPYALLQLGGTTSESSDVAAGTPQNALRLIDAARDSLAGLPLVVSGRDEASPIVQAVAAAAGAHIRAGFEDAATLPDGSPASSNGQLVEHAVRLAAALGRSPMTPDDARRLLR